MFDQDWPEAVRRTYDTSLAALARYRPTAYAGPVVFFRAAARSFYLPDSPRRMWSKLLGALHVVTVPGDHVDMVGANAPVLGQEIADSIAGALARADKLVSL
jgi:thioesterase domain-containing protein